MDRYDRAVNLRRALAGQGPQVAVAAGLFLLALATLHMSPQGTDAWSAGGVALSLAIAALLPLAARRPVAGLGSMTALFLVAQASYGLIPVLAILLVAAVFTVAAADVAGRRFVLGAAVAVAVAVDASAQLTHHDTWTDSAYLVMATTVLGAAAAGDALRSRRAYVRAIEDRARRAEEERQREVRRQVAEERLRIARDVHDLVAHRLAVVKVQAEVADQLLDDRPTVARQALDQVRSAAGSALGELGSLIGVLRRPEDGGPAPVEPPPTLASLADLVASFEATGLSITSDLAGLARPLPPAVGLTAYRIVQESLTNAYKHGAGDATLRISCGADHVDIEVANPTAPAGPGATVAAAPRCGHGLVGMRERVAATGGTLRVDDTRPGRFSVRAVLPVPAP